MRSLAVAVLGGILLVAGIALLVLPGPGFVLIAAGLAVLATRFEWARRWLAHAKDKAQQGVDDVARSRWRALLAAACALGLIGLGVAVLAGLQVPLLNTLSAVLLIAGGLFLLGTVVYARVKGPRAGHPRESGGRSEPRRPDIPAHP